jgi:hypothetical protein
VQVAASIQIVLLPDGRVDCKYQGPGDVVFFGMLEKARAAMSERFRAEAAKAVQPAPPGLVNRLSQNGQ